MNAQGRVILAAMLALTLAPAAEGAPKKGKTAAPVVTAADSVQAHAYARASWLGDRVPLKVGDLLTVTIDEQTAAHERVGRTATGNRTTRASLNALINTSSNQANISTGMANDSKDDGETQRQGDLTATLTVHVTSVAPNGVAQIEGSKKVVVDGRTQEVSLKGSVRPDDVSANNEVRSDNIADAVIAYKGKDIGPRKSFIGKLLGALWP
jgi:flagellar L-ring protein FlgH